MPMLYSILLVVQISPFSFQDRLVSLAAFCSGAKHPQFQHLESSARGAAGQFVTDSAPNRSPLRTARISIVLLITITQVNNFPHQLDVNGIRKIEGNTKIDIQLSVASGRWQLS
jgi:hypothetical protein